MTMTQCRDAIRGNSNSTGSRVLELLSEHGLDSSIDDEVLTSKRSLKAAAKEKVVSPSGKKYPY